MTSYLEATLLKTPLTSFSFSSRGTCLNPKWVVFWSVGGGGGGVEEEEEERGRVVLEPTILLLAGCLLDARSAANPRFARRGKDRKGEAMGGVLCCVLCCGMADRMRWVGGLGWGGR